MQGAIRKLLRRYGSAITLERQGKRQEFYGLLRHTAGYSWDSLDKAATPLGQTFGAKYTLVAPAQPPLQEGDVLILEDRSYYLRRLETESMKMAYCLRGLSALRGESVKLTPITRPRDLPWRALEKCFHRTRKLWEEMDRRNADPECGPVYRRLAQMAQEHCTVLAELLGKIE